jgi:multiple sugar transport system substrate-binding protein
LQNFQKIKLFNRFKKGNKMQIFISAKRIKLAAIVGAVALIGSLAAPAYAAKEITVFVTVSPSSDALKAIAPSFTAKTKIKVNFVTVPTSDIITKLLLACQTKSSSNDVVQFDSQHVTALATAGCLDDVGARAAQSKEYQDSRIPEQLKLYGTYQDKQVGLPLSTEPYILWYRKDLYQKLGLNIPRSWTQYAANAKKCQAAGYYGSDIPYGSAAAAYRIGAMVLNYGGNFFDPTTYEPTFNDPRTKAAIKMAMSLVYTTPASVIAGGGLVAVQAMQQLDVCQMLNATGWWSILGDPKQSPRVFDKLALADAPKMNHSKETFLFGWLIGINQFSNQKTEAFQFLEYALGKSNAKAFLEAGAPPTGRLVSGPALATLAKAAPYYKVLNQANTNAVPMYRVPEITEILDVTNRTLNAMATKQISFDAGIAKMNSDVRSIFVNSGRLKK